MAAQVTFVGLPCGCSPTHPCLRARHIVDGSLSWTDARGSLRWHFIAGLRKEKMLKDRARWKVPPWKTPAADLARCLERGRKIAAALASVRAKNLEAAERGR